MIDEDKPEEEEDLPEGEPARTGDADQSGGEEQKSKDNPDESSDGSDEASAKSEAEAKEEEQEDEDSEASKAKASSKETFSMEKSGSSDVIHVTGMYQNWFLDYASYVILERAVPGVNDGLKPVQRRILHSLKELDDGRYHKVANLIGNTMKYHPHGDASIGDALVQLGQKDLLIDMQGNWGNILTGDSAAAPRYIEARLSKFALEVAFNHKTTEWQASYDGRSKEPIALPMKFPLLLAQGVEGIAVGLACKIMPHNFNELINASIKALRGKKFDILPDFPTGGLADFSQYNKGLRGGKIRVRAKIGQVDKKSLIVSELPFGSTTTSLIDSIIRANDKGKIKVKKVEDNTAENVEIIIHLPAGTSPDKTIDALYAFTDCEQSISPNSCIIEDDKPRFIGVDEILKISAQRTIDLLKLELEIRKKELENQWHFLSLEKIFIEKRIYRDIEEAETWEAVIKAIQKGLKPHLKDLKQDVTEDDIVRLTEIKIKRISKFDSNKADDNIKKIEASLKEIKHHLKNLTDYAVDYYKELKKKYGAERKRKTEIKSFENIIAAKVAVDNVKLYVNREEGFAGFGMRKDEYVCDCSDIDDIIFFRADGVMMVSKISSKTFVGKNIVHLGVFKKSDSRTIYNMIYRDGARGNVMMKRFAVTGVTRDKEYLLTKGKEGSKIMYFTANPNGESEVLVVNLKPKPRLKKTKFELDFGEVAIKGRGAGGNILTKNSVSKIVLKEKGVSTLGARKIWFDDSVHRLNVDERGDYLGEFLADDKILTVTQSGHYELYSFSLSNHFDEDMILIEKWRPNRPLTAIHYDGAKKHFFVKRFLVEGLNRKVPFITEHADSFLEHATIDAKPVVELTFAKNKSGKDRGKEKVELENFIGIKGFKAAGNRMSQHKVKSIDILDSLEEDPEVEEITQEEIEDIDATPTDSDEEIVESEPEEEQPEVLQDPDSEPAPKPKSKKKPKKGGDDSQIELDL